LYPGAVSELSTAAIGTMPQGFSRSHDFIRSGACVKSGAFRVGPYGTLDAISEPSSA
jgi:hypothetical protein